MHLHVSKAVNDWIMRPVTIQPETRIPKSVNCCLYHVHINDSFVVVMQEQRNDRETIRKKLAMDSGAENEMFRTQPSFKKAYSAKPANTNLQICFMNEEQEGSNPPLTQVSVVLMNRLI